MKDPSDRESYVVVRSLQGWNMNFIPWRLEGKGLAWRRKGEAPAAFDPGV